MYYYYYFLFNVIFGNLSNMMQCEILIQQSLKFKWFFNLIIFICNSILLYLFANQRTICVIRNDEININVCQKSSLGLNNSDFLLDWSGKP